MRAFRLTFGFDDEVFADDVLAFKPLEDFELVLVCADVILTSFVFATDLGFAAAFFTGAFADFETTRAAMCPFPHLYPLPTLVGLKP